MEKCKFCGGNGVINENGGEIYVRCDGCGARSFGFATEEEAVKSWNEMMGGEKDDHTTN